MKAQEEKDTKAKEIADGEAKTKEQQDVANKGFADQLQQELDEDLKAIYAAGDLPKITNKDDENDAGNKEFKNLFTTAQTVNAKRAAEGKTLIRSIQTIRYGKDETGKPFYIPLVTKPAGHDAPVLGNESPLSNQAPEDRYVPARDRAKPMKQLMKEEAVRLAKKLNVRGN